MRVETISADLVDKVPRIVDLNNRAQLELLLDSICKLSKQRLRVEIKDRQGHQDEEDLHCPNDHIELYRLRLKDLCERIDLDVFIKDALSLPEEHPNTELCHRILDVY